MKSKHAKQIKLLIALLGSALMMTYVLNRIEWITVVELFREMNPYLMFAGMLFFIPQFIIFALRWQVLCRKKTSLSLWDSLRVLFASSAVNLILPSKAGDLSKVVFMKQRFSLDLTFGAAAAVFEKLLDVGALSAVALTAALLAGVDRPIFMFYLLIITVTAGCFTLILGVGIFFRTSNSGLTEGRNDALKTKLHELRRFICDILMSGDMPRLAALSLTAWFFQCFQFCLMFWAFGSTLQVTRIISLVPAAILAGTLPISISGIGSRDTALLHLFLPFEQESLIAAVGVAATVRYLLPCIVGIPFLYVFLFEEKKRPEAAGDQPVSPKLSDK